MKKHDRWAAYRDAEGRINFDAMPGKLKKAFIRESERARGGPLSATERGEFEAWRKRAVGRPRNGEGFQRWNISLEKAFARRVSAYARTHRMSRSRVLAEGAKLLMAHTNN